MDEDKDLMIVDGDTEDDEISLDTIPVKERPPFPEGWTQEARGKLLYSFDEEGKAKCGALKKDRTYCNKSPMIDRNRCHKHGGKTPRGIQSVHLKHGRYSKDHHPVEVIQRYEEAVNDPELLSLRAEIALIGTRIDELYDRYTAKQKGGTSWTEAKKAYYKLVDALKAKKDDESVKALSKLGAILKDEAGDYALWNDIAYLTEVRRKLVESERKRMIEMKQMMTNEQAMALVGGVIESVRNHITDQDKLDRISQDIAVLMSRRRRE